MSAGNVIVSGQVSPLVVEYLSQNVAEILARPPFHQSFHARVYRAEGCPVVAGAVYLKVYPFSKRFDRLKALVRGSRASSRYGSIPNWCLSIKS